MLSLPGNYNPQIVRFLVSEYNVEMGFLYESNKKFWPEEAI
jgi:hypothetical protein